MSGWVATFEMDIRSLILNVSCFFRILHPSGTLLIQIRRKTVRFYRSSGTVVLKLLQIGNISLNKGTTVLAQKNSGKEFFSY